jgi:hypothetical protein
MAIGHQLGLPVGLSLGTDTPSGAGSSFTPREPSSSRLTGGSNELEACYTGNLVPVSSPCLHVGQSLL